MIPNSKVLMLLPHVGAGGDWTFVRSLSRALLKMGYELQLGANNIQVDQKAIYLKTYSLNINQGAKGFFQSVTQIFKFDRDIEVIHANSANTLLFAILLRLLWCSRAVIVFTFHLYLEDDSLRLAFKRFLFSWADYLHCSSEALKSQIEKYYPSLQEKIVLIHLGADEKLFHRVSDSEREGFRQQFNLSKDDFVLLYAGRLNPEKNVHLILETLAKESDAHPNLKLLIAGTGPCRSSLAEFVKQSNLEHCVRFIGHWKEMRSLYGACDLLILPSYARETFGLVIVEAALCGLPSLRSNISGAIDQITDGVNGLLFENNNAEQFHAQLVRAIANPEKTKAMGEAAYTTAIEKFTAARMAWQFNSLYKTMLLQPGTGIKDDVTANF
jgi:glycosyltransferase involved in cell wall biosynthesis